MTKYRLGVDMYYRDLSSIFRSPVLWIPVNTAGLTIETDKVEVNGVIQETTVTFKGVNLPKYCDVKICLPSILKEDGGVYRENRTYLGVENGKGHMFDCIYQVKTQ